MFLIKLSIVLINTKYSDVRQRFAPNQSSKTRRALEVFPCLKIPSPAIILSMRKILCSFFLTAHCAIANTLLESDINAIDQLGNFPDRQVILTKKTDVHRFTNKWYEKYEYQKTRYAILAPDSVLISLLNKKKVKNQKEMIVKIKPDIRYEHQVKILNKNGKPIYLVDGRKVTLIDDIIDLKEKPERFTLAENSKVEFINPSYFLHWDFKYYIDRYANDPYSELFQTDSTNIFSQKFKLNFYLRGKLPVYLGLSTSLLNDSFNPQEGNSINRLSVYAGPIIKTPSWNFGNFNLNAYISYEHGFWEQLSAQTTDLFGIDSDLLEIGFEARRRILGQSIVFGLSYYRQWISYSSEFTDLNIDSENNIFDGLSFFLGARFTYQL